MRSKKLKFEHFFMEKCNISHTQIHSMCERYVFGLLNPAFFYYLKKNKGHIFFKASDLWIFANFRWKFRPKINTFVKIVLSGKLFCIDITLHLFDEQFHLWWFVANMIFFFFFYKKVPFYSSFIIFYLFVRCICMQFYG